MESFFYALSTKLLALSFMVQLVEYYYLRAEFTDQGVWRWETLRGDYGPASRMVFDRLFSYRGTMVILSVGALGAWGTYAFPEYPFAGLVFLSSWLMAARFRGTFNGGSDFMTVLVSGALTIAILFPEQPLVARLAFMYVGAQTLLSYFVAGLVKIRHREWRSGRALAEILRKKKYGVPEHFTRLADNPWLMRGATWGVLLFECLFPVVLISRTALPVFLICAAAFHALNAWIFGLNRFFFAWLAAYPLLYYTCLVVEWGLKTPTP